MERRSNTSLVAISLNAKFSRKTMKPGWVGCSSTELLGKRFDVESPTGRFPMRSSETTEGYSGCFRLALFQIKELALLNARPPELSKPYKLKRRGTELLVEGRFTDKDQIQLSNTIAAIYSILRRQLSSCDLRSYPPERI
ncbi:hypothetical protein N7541_000021 [Penicillium brevicompactum]|uniref:Uncharacterized protein n=1 Tax=Penicillium brevicompactum TaxID=5074 RepID=A0A9W9RTF8_PENBR|nr:hypothetical protein N7541_000021 [Penicillium brevicompactum]